MLYANSSVRAMPVTSAPASRSAWTALADTRSGRASARKPGTPPPIGWPATAKRSFTATRTPASGRPSPLAPATSGVPTVRHTLPSRPPGSGASATEGSGIEVREPDPGVHALHEIDDLGDVEVGRRAQVRERIRSVHAEPRMQQLDRGTHAVLHGLVQVLAEAGGHEVLGREH